MPEELHSTAPTEETISPRLAEDPKQNGPAPSTEIDPALSSGCQDGGEPGNGSSMRKGEDKIQILDLHSRNPLISFQGQIYSCAWATTIGTDVLLTHPSSGVPFEPELKLKGVNVLSATGIKLLGTPVQLVPKRDVRADKLTKKAEVTAIQQVVDQRHRQQEATSTQQHSNTPMSDVAKGKRPEGIGEKDGPPAILEPLKLPIGPQNGRAKNLQARFLERIANAKARKGDTDKVILNSKKKLTGSGWRAWYSQKEDAVTKGRGADEDEDERDDREQDAVDVDEDAVNAGNPGDGAPGPQDQDEEMRDDEDEDEENSVDSDDHIELLFPTKLLKKQAARKDDPPVQPPRQSVVFEASSELYLTPAEREDIMRSTGLREGGESRDVGGGRGRGRGGGGSKSSTRKKARFANVEGRDASEDRGDADVRMRGT